MHITTELQMHFLTAEQKHAKEWTLMVQSLVGRTQAT